MFKNKKSLETYAKKAISIGGIIGLIILKGFIDTTIDTFITN